MQHLEFPKQRQYNKTTNPQVPSTLGQGHTGQEDKVSTSLHMGSLESWGVNDMLRGFDEVQCFTHDLGTEAKITYFQMKRSEMHLYVPSWLAHRRGRPPLQDEFDPQPGDGDGYVNPLVQCSGDEFLRNALPLPGINHLIHGMVKGLHEALPMYADFFSMLKVIEMVLTHPGRRERVVATCFENSVWSAHNKCIEAFSFTLHEPRWHAVAAFCRAAAKPIGILRRCWSQAQYEERGVGILLERDWSDQGQAKFNPKELTSILQSAFFRGYHAMILRMNSIPSKFASWFDSCPCHECLLTSKTTRETRARALQLEGMEESCVCMSCRGYEAVDGKLDSVLDEVSAECQDELHATLDEKERDGFSEPLSTEERAGIVAEWFRGLAFIQFGFSVKFGFLKKPALVAYGDGASSYGACSVLGSEML